MLGVEGIGCLGGKMLGRRNISLTSAIILLISTFNGFSFSAELAGIVQYRGTETPFSEIYFTQFLRVTSDEGEIINRVFMGTSSGNAYILDSFLIQAGLDKKQVGFKTTVFSGSSGLGSFAKFAYPPLKEEKRVFMLPDYAYQDRLLDDYNQATVKGIAAVSTLFAGVKEGDIDIKVRTYQSLTDQTLNVSGHKELRWFREFSAEAAWRFNAWNAGLAFVPGQMSDYYYTNVFKTENGRPLNQYRDILIYAVEKGDWTINFGLYEQSRLQFVKAQLISKSDQNTSVYLAYLDQLNQVFSVYFGLNYSINAYVMWNYLDDPNYMAGVDFPCSAFNLLLAYRKLTLSTGTYQGLIYSMSNAMDWFGGKLQWVVGNTTQTSVWDLWSILPVSHMNVSLSWRMSL
ncbi:MAG: hypothetical protein AABZ14_07530 [Candidatus Margulisiibacteriota bacterium]